MKVTFITKEYPPYVYGGAGVHVKYLAQELSKIMDVEVRAFGDQNSVEKTLAARGFPEWDILKKSKTGLHSSVLSTLSGDLAIADEPVTSDVVHTHTWYSSFAGYLIKTLYKIPLVVTCHSLEPLRPWKTDQIGRGYDISLWVEKLAVESADAVIAVSQEMKEDILKLFPRVKPSRVRVVHNGVDLNKWRPRKERNAQKKYGLPDKYALFFGRTTKQKGIDVLIDAADMIDPSAKIVICTAGADTKEYLAEIEARAKSKPNIIFINEMIDEDDCVEIYSGASVFVCPSVYEPFGIINLEAMACKVPVVASRVGGIKEIVVDGKTGFFIEPGRPKELAEKVNRLLKDKATAREFGEAGRLRVEEKFGWPAIAAQTKKLYEDIIKK
ncbi:MAG: glycogen synthase [Elusimicrobia bacterium HGW-Elusimicrobia-1]|jgi:glycogen synthase|nr:MAG: glycogen synthase [Elusimicrobia bacterium HGW-Elusimicrobia-1]